NRAMMYVCDYDESQLPDITCYAHPENSSDIDICTGHYCYSSTVDGGSKRGCMAIVDDTLAKKRSDGRNLVAPGFYQFIQLQLYLCSSNYCNDEGIAEYKARSRVLRDLNQTTTPNVESTT
ncbi:hypothetical protein PMAYCL1PPCAC_21773, partial [Pristionchus mayeri]